MRSKLINLKEAISKIKDGSSVAIGGIGQNKVPMAAVMEIIRQGKKNLHIKGLFGSDLFKVREDFKEITCPFTKERLVAVPAINPDVGIIHCQEADEYGNVRIYGTLFEDIFIAKASKYTIVTVEKIITNDEIRREPEKTTIPYFYVDAVVECPEGAKPTSLYGYYLVDREMMKKLIKGE